MSTKAQERAASAIKVVAAATLSARSATAEQRELAQAVLGATEAAELAGELEAPREAEQLADAFNRQMDAAIDAADRSRKADDRATRRAYLARSLEAHGLVLLDAAEMARMVLERRELAFARSELAVRKQTIADMHAELEAREGESLGAELLEEHGFVRAVVAPAPSGRMESGSFEAFGFEIHEDPSLAPGEMRMDPNVND